MQQATFIGICVGTSCGSYAWHMYTCIARKWHIHVLLHVLSSKLRGNELVSDLSIERDSSRPDWKLWSFKIRRSFFCVQLCIWQAFSSTYMHYFFLLSQPTFVFVLWSSISVCCILTPRACSTAQNARSYYRSVNCYPSIIRFYPPKW